MDMTINRSTTANAASPVSNLAKGVDRKAFGNLRDDLKSGDMDGAKQAFSTLTRNVPASVLSDSSTALGQLNEALQSGDTSGAQKALGDFAQNVHTYRSGGPVSGGPVSVPVSANPVTSSTGGTAGTLVNAIA